MSEQEELATGGVIENSPLLGQESGHEGVYWGPMQSGTFHVQFGPGGTTVNPTLCNPGGPMLPVGWNSGAGYQQPVYQPSNTFPTEQSLREFVKRCVHEALDELAAEMNNKALQPTSRVE